MHDELDSLLCERYPKIFRDRHADMSVTAMCWGIACGDGWFNIVDQLCRQIQWHIDTSRDSLARATIHKRVLQRALDGDERGLRWWYSKGAPNKAEWVDKQVTEQLSKPHLWEVRNACPQVVATQVKEKFGTLRFYYDGGDDVVRGLVQMAEALSEVTCEVCGSPGKRRGDRWVRTLCDEHDKSDSR